MNEHAMNNQLSHIQNGQPIMVDVSEKQMSKRTAKARAIIQLGAEVMSLFEHHDIQGPKGPVLQTAIIAGTMAVKKTSDWIPFCHPLLIEKCKFHTSFEDHSLIVECEVSIQGKTGVEMEALTGVSAFALTVYDMCKAVNKAIVIHNIELVSKSGGKSDDYIKITAPK